MHEQVRQHRFDAVIFDLGSTLIYFDASWPEVIAEQHLALTRHLKEFGYSLDEEQFASAFFERLNAYYVERETEFIEKSTEHILRTLLAEYGYPHAPSKHLRPALDTMYAVTQAHWKAEEDTHDTLRRLHEEGYRLGLISNANDAVDVQKLIDIWNLRAYFQSILISADLGIRKPHPGIFQLALDRLAVAPERAVMVGDTLGADVLGARNAGLASVWITRRAATPGNHDHLDTIVPDAMVAALKELPGLLANWPGKNGQGSS